MRKFTCFTLGLLLACAVTVNAQEQKNDQEGYKFTDIKRLPTTSVKSQDRAGTCWSWSTISFLESEIMRMGKDSLSLSPMYVVWNTYHAKGDKYVRMNGHVNFGQGGASADVTWGNPELRYCSVVFIQRPELRRRGTCTRRIGCYPERLSGRCCQQS